MLNYVCVNYKMANCSRKGKEYEVKILNIIKNTFLKEKRFNIQKISELGGCSSKNDLECIGNVGIEVKQKNTPDWMQCGLKYNKSESIWEGSKIGKIPEKSKELFNDIIKEFDIFNGKIPPFISKNITHDEWIKVKNNTNDWDDNYIDIPSDTIRKMYKNKGCYYIQISNGLGLYHTGYDIYNFDVPEFTCEQEIRIRTKIHNRKNKKGFCQLSVTAACKPKYINKIKKSKYSLDDIKKLPRNLKYTTYNLTMNNKSPLRYPGGKTRACKIIDDVISNTFYMNDKTRVISPFFGGGSVEFYLQNKYGFDIVANDKFRPLYNFWDICKNKKHKLTQYLYQIHSNKVSKSVFQKYREEILGERDDIQIACKYFVINRCSFSGATLSGGFSSLASEKRFTESSIQRVENLDLNKFYIYNEDFSKFILEYKDSPNSIMFLDPPYLLENGKNKLYGNSGDLHENFNHKLLAELLKKCKIDWILTYNNCEEIRRLYDDFEIIHADWSYSMNKSKKSSEIIITSKKQTSFSDKINNTIENTMDIFITEISNKYKINKTHLKDLWKNNT